MRTGTDDRGPENGHRWARPIFRPHRYPRVTVGCGWLISRSAPGYKPEAQSIVRTKFPPVGTQRSTWIVSPNQVTGTNERHRCHNPPAFTRQGEVEESTLPRHKRPIPYLRALLGLFPAKDVVAYTPAEVAEWANVPNAFVTTALREGRILYAG